MIMIMIVIIIIIIIIIIINVTEISVLELLIWILGHHNIMINILSFNIILSWYFWSYMLLTLTFLEDFIVLDHLVLIFHLTTSII